MKKEFTIRIYKQKAGEHYESFVEEIYSGNDKKEAFAEGREELVRIANCDLNSGVSESSEEDILEEIRTINNGSNNYYHDQTTYFFKVFSKLTKKS